MAKVTNTAYQSLHATYIICLLHILLSQHLAHGYTIFDVHRLKKALFVDQMYDKEVRPLLNQTHVLDIYIAVSVASVVDFNMINGRLMVTGFLSVSWTDEQLRWNITDFPGVTRISIPDEVIWTPELLQAYDLGSGFSFAPAFVTYDGRVSWFPAGTFYSFCEINIFNYPYDSHECVIPFLPSEYDGIELRLIATSNEIDVQSFTMNGEWEITKTSTKTVSVVRSGFVFTSFVAELRLSRRPAFVIIHTYFPLLLLWAMQIFVFMVPLNGGERVSFAVTVLLSIVFFTTGISASLPRNSTRTSVFSIIMLLTICFSATTVAFSVVLVNIAAETVKPVPRWLRSTIYGCINLRRGKKYPGGRNDNRVTDVEDNDVSEESMEAKPEMKTDRTEFREKVKRRQSKTFDTLTWFQVAENLNRVLFYVNLVFVLVSALTWVIFNCQL